MSIREIISPLVRRHPMLEHTPGGHEHDQSKHAGGGKKKARKAKKLTLKKVDTIKDELAGEVEHEYEFNDGTPASIFHYPEMKRDGEPSYTFIVYGGYDRGDGHDYWSLRDAKSAMIDWFADQRRGAIPESDSNPDITESLRPLLRLHRITEHGTTTQQT